MHNVSAVFSAYSIDFVRLPPLIVIKRPTEYLIENCCSCQIRNLNKFMPLEEWWLYKIPLCRPTCSRPELALANSGLCSEWVGRQLLLCHVFILCAGTRSYMDQFKCMSVWHSLSSSASIERTLHYMWIKMHTKQIKLNRNTPKWINIKTPVASKYNQIHSVVCVNRVL